MTTLSSYRSRRKTSTFRSFRSALAAALFALPLAFTAQAVEVVVSFEASLEPGTCDLDCLGGLGGTLSGTFIYESTSAGSGTNPRSYPLTSFDFTTFLNVSGGATFGTVSIANDVSAPPADAITIAGGGLFGSATTLSLTYLNLQAIDEDGTVFSSTDLPTSAPSLAFFETAYINMTWSDGSLQTWSPTWRITSWTTGFIPGGDCCSAHSAPSCDEATCASAVCAADSFCCTNEWDSVCVARAATTCAICGSGSSGGSCPVVGTGPRAALEEWIPTEPPFDGTGLGSADTARGWRFTADSPDLFIDRLGALTAASDGVPHTVTLFDHATQAVLAQGTTTPGAGWRWVPIVPVPLVEGADYVVAVHSTVAVWLWSGLRADIGERWFPTTPLAYVGSYLAIGADPSTFPGLTVPDSQQGIADVGYSYGSCFDAAGGDAGTIVDSTSGLPGQSIDLRVDNPGLVSDLDVSIRLAQNGGAPGSPTWWDDLRMTLSKNGKSYPLNVNPTGSVNGVFDVVFDAEAAQSIASAKVAPGDAVGSYRPDGDGLEPFVGEMLAGVWELSFEDVSSNTNETVLEAWSLEGRVLDEPAILECAEEGLSGSGDFAGSRGIRFQVDQSFQGVRLVLSASVAGDYTFDAELRRSTGFVVTPEVTVQMETPLPTSSYGRSVPIDFGRVPVVGLETFTLKMTNFSGPGTPYLETLGIGNTPCPGVEETENNTSATPTERSDPNQFSVIGLPEPALWPGLASGVLLLSGIGGRRRSARGLLGSASGPPGC